MSAPVALRPFVRALEPFDTHVATALSRWLPRLSLLVGPLAVTEKSGGDVDGVDGVARKGPYERLLLSEWAMALEMPDEFMRRAVMNEHLFVELARRQPHGALQSLIVVDPGPDQLGSPRLVHIAAALVAEARASKAKAAFAWGAACAGSEPVRVFPRVDVESVRHVLDARRSVPLTVDVLERWHVAVSQFDGTVDVLFVGGAHLERVVASSSFAAESARVLRIDQPARGGVVVATIGKRALEMPLPDDATCVRALRDPFEKEQRQLPAPLLDVIPQGGLSIPLGGRRILVRTSYGVASIAEPNSPRAPLGPAKLLGLAPSDAVIAAGLVGKRTMAIVRGIGGKLFVVFAGERTEIAGDDDGDGRIPGTSRLRSGTALDQVRMLTTMGGDQPVDASKTPWPINGIDGRPRGFFVGDQGYALIPFHRRVTELTSEMLLPPIVHKNVTLSVRRSTGAVVVTAFGVHTSIPMEVPRFPSVFLGALRGAGVVPGALAIKTDSLASPSAPHASGRWCLIVGRVHEFVGELPLVVIGCAYHPTHGACLVAREDGRRLAFVRPSESAPGYAVVERHAFASEIVAVAPNLELPQLAVLTADGAVTVLFTKTGVRSIVCRAPATPTTSSTSQAAVSSEAPTPVRGVNLVARLTTK